MNTLTPADYAGYWDRAISYQQYISNVATEAASNPTEGYSKYVPINWVRMQRITKTVQLSPIALQTLSQLTATVYWLIITENWCGDSAHSTPLMEKMAEATNGKIVLRFIYRDTNLDLMNAHLTGTSQSIPKVIQLDPTFHVIGTWGPRPDKAHQLVLRLKSNPATAHTYSEELQKWYAQDKMMGTEAGLLDLVKEAIAGQNAPEQTAPQTPPQIDATLPPAAPAPHPTKD